MQELDRSGVAANENILIHSRAAEAIARSLNSTAASIEEFHEPLGVPSVREETRTVRRRKAWRDPGRWKTAGKDAGGGTEIWNLRRNRRLPDSQACKQAKLG
jgi:hypothetical protein